MQVTLKPEHTAFLKEFLGNEVKRFEDMGAMGDPIVMAHCGVVKSILDRIEIAEIELAREKFLTSGM